MEERKEKDGIDIVSTHFLIIYGEMNEQIRLKVLLETVLQRHLFCNIVFF